MTASAFAVAGQLQSIGRSPPGGRSADNTDEP